MKRFILIPLITFFTLSGCITQERCNRKFPPQVRDSIVVDTRVVYRDTIVTVRLEPERKLQVVPLAVDKNGMVSMPKRIAHIATNYAESDVMIVNNRLYHSLEQPDTTLSFSLKDVLKETISSREHYRTVYKTVGVNKLTWWQKTQIYGFRFYLGVSLAAGALYFVKRTLKP